MMTVFFFKEAVGLGQARNFIFGHAMSEKSG